MVDTSKKANRKCEYCEHWKDYRCTLTDTPKNYWNSCKKFAWRACYVSPENVEARKKLHVEKVAKALEKKDKEIQEYEKNLAKLKEDRRAVYHEFVKARREFYGTKSLRVGDTLYYINYEEFPNATYLITGEIEVGEDDVCLKPGKYFVVTANESGVGGYVRMEEVNHSRFFTTPERAHAAYEEFKALLASRECEASQGTGTT